MSHLSNGVLSQKPASLKDLLLGLLTAVTLGVISMVLLPFAVLPVGHIWLAALCALAVRRGAVSGYMGAACITLSSFLLFNAQIALFVGLIVFGALTVLLFLLSPKYNFTSQLLYGSGAMVVLILLAAVLFQWQHGPIIETVTSLFRQMLTLTPQIQASFEQSIAQLYGEGVGIDILMYSFQESLRQTLPGNVLAYCVFGAGFAIFVSRKTAARMGKPELAGQKEDLAKWAMPKYSARILGGTALICYGLAMMVNSGFTPTANAVWQLFQSLFAIHGACMMCYLMRLRGSSSVARVLLCGALLLFLPVALMLTALFERTTPSPRVNGGKILVVQRPLNGDGEQEMRELDEEELPEFFKELMRNSGKYRARGEKNQQDQLPKPENKPSQDQEASGDDPDKKDP